MNFPNHLLKPVVLSALVFLFALPSEAQALQTPNSPISPEDYSECRVLHQQWRELFRSVVENYRQCSRDNRNTDCKTSKGPDGTIICHRCQKWFTFKWRMHFGDLKELRSQQLSTCGRQVREYKRILREANRKQKNDREDLIAIENTSSKPSTQNDYFKGRAKRVLLNQAEWSSKKLAVDLAKKEITGFKFAVEVQKKVAKIERRASLASDFMKLFDQGGTTNEKLRLVSRSAVELKYATGIHPLSDFIFARSFGAVTAILTDSMTTFEREFSQFPTNSTSSNFDLISKRLQGINRLHFFGIPRYVSSQQRAIAARENAESFESHIIRVVDEIVREKLAERQRQAASASPPQQTASPSQYNTQASPRSNACDEEFDRLTNESFRLTTQMQNLPIGSSEWSRLFEQNKATVQRLNELNCSF